MKLLQASDDQEAVRRAFETVWSPASIERVRSILKRALGASYEAGAKPYLDCGTLLGYVREGRILPWDDDVDLLVVGGGWLEKIAQNLKSFGLHGIFPDHWYGTGLKIYDPEYQTVGNRYEWTWPNVDIFKLDIGGDKCIHAFLGREFEQNFHSPGHLEPFEGSQCWVPEKAMDILDRLYPDWRTVEISNHLCHRTETTIPTQYSRRIITNNLGRKV